MAPITIDEFPGLDLTYDVGEMGFNGAANLENVNPRRKGLPTRRSGAKVFNAIPPATGSYLVPFVGATAVPAATSSGPRSAGTVAHTAGFSVDWSNASNAQTSDNAYATCVAAIPSYSDFLTASNFGFAIPTTATVTGIVAEMERKSSVASASGDYQVYATKTVGVSVGSNKLSPDYWPTSDAYQTYGAASDLWGTTWTPAEINASGFGFQITAYTTAATLSVDHMRITVHYTLPSDSVKSVYATRMSGASTIIDRLDGVHGGLASSSTTFGSAGSGGKSCRFAQLGTPAATYVFCSSGLDNDNAPMRFDGSSFTNTGYTGTSPIGSCVAVTPWDNRLISAGGSTATWASRVNFSDEGAPLTFTAANTLELHPGDGEYIHDVVTWGNQVFVFKQTKFFVFYGVSTDSTGGPVFEYRTYLGKGVADTSQSTLAVAGTDGVYFVNQSGVFRTTGGAAQPVSHAIAPLFSGVGSVNPYFDVTRRAPTGLHHARGRLYLTFEALTDTLVYDIEGGWWSVYDLPSGGVTGVAEDPASSTGRAIVAIDSPDLYALEETTTQDGATDEVHSVVATGGSAGTFTLVYSGQTTANINWDDTAAEVQTALEALSNIAVGDVYCYGGPLPTAKIYIKFEGTLAATDVSDLTVGTEAVTNGNATLAVERTGAAATPISCEWASGGTDFGVDARKVIKELVATATDGTLGIAVSTELNAFPAATTEAFSGTESLRYRSAATNCRGRLFAVKLSNSTATEATSEFNVHHLALRLMAPSSEPAHGSDT